MSKEIRQTFDKVKNFKQFVNEQKLNKGRTVIYQFSTQAISRDTKWDKKDEFSTHNVYLTRGDKLKDDKFNGVILSIEDTPGAWYVDTLYEYHNPPAIDYDTMSIYGTWICTNWSEIMKELKKWVGENF